MRKRIFSAFRGQFEQIFLSSKEKVIATISRRVGSGAEIFNQAARYFNRTTELIYKHDGRIETPEFRAEYEDILNTLLASQQKKRFSASQDLNSNVTTNVRVSQSRSFQGTFRSEALIPGLLNSFQICPICGGKMKVSEGVHIDHDKMRHADGGPTAAFNAAPTHAFCNRLYQGSLYKISDLLAG